MAELKHISGHATVFRYHAIEVATGRPRRGERSGMSAYEVRTNLRRVGLEADTVEPVGEWAVPSWLHPLLRSWQARQRRRHRMAKADLFDGLATLVRAGMPLEQAVASLAISRARGEKERRMLRAMRDRLREGRSLSEVCADFPSWFDRLDVALLDAGQQAGDLAGTLRNLGRMHLRAGAVGQRLFVALIYPAILLIAGLGVLEFVSFQTLPKLLALITDAHHQAPWLSERVLALGQGLAQWWPFAVGAIIAAIFAVRAAVGRVPLESAAGRWLYGNPVARARARIRVAQMAMSLANLRRAGMPLVDALLVVATTVSERALRQLILAGVDAIKRGEDLSSVMGSSPLLDPEFAQLLHLGERSGELTEMLEQIADRYQRAADHASERLAAVLGPVAIIFLAALIGVVVIACALPLVQLGDLI